MYIDARMRGVRSLEYADKLNIGDSKAQKECRACMRDWGRVALRRADAQLDHIPGLQLADRIRPGPECIGMRKLPMRYSHLCELSVLQNRRTNVCACPTASQQQARRTYCGGTSLRGNTRF